MSMGCPKRPLSWLDRDPSICEGHVRPRDERASAGLGRQALGRDQSAGQTAACRSNKNNSERGGAKMEVVQER